LLRWLHHMERAWKQKVNTLSVLGKGCPVRLVWLKGRSMVRHGRGLWGCFKMDWYSGTLRLRGRFRHRHFSTPKSRLRHKSSARLGQILNQQQSLPLVQAAVLEQDGTEEHAPNPEHPPPEAGRRQSFVSQRWYYDEVSDTDSPSQMVPQWPRVRTALPSSTWPPEARGRKKTFSPHKKLGQQGARSQEFPGQLVAPNQRETPALGKAPAFKKSPALEEAPASGPGKAPMVKSDHRGALPPDSVPSQEATVQQEPSTGQTHGAQRRRSRNKNVCDLESSMPARPKWPRMQPTNHQYGAAGGGGTTRRDTDKVSRRACTDVQLWIQVFDKKRATSRKAISCGPCRRVGLCQRQPVHKSPATIDNAWATTTTE
jgi:hypothetical protein